MPMSATAHAAGSSARRPPTPMAEPGDVVLRASCFSRTAVDSSCRVADVIWRED